MTITAFPINTVLPTALLIGSTPFGIVTANNVQGAINQLAAASGAITTLPASSVTNIPSGPITATNVQAALNQLAGLIPAPGAGTDPLALVHGESIIVTDPAIDGNIFDRYALRVAATTSTVNTDPSFANTQAAEFTLNVLHGQNTYNILTQAKESFFAIANSVTSVGAGQKFVQNNSVTGYGMGDIAIYGNQSVNFASGPVAGDEGVGWQLNSQLKQQDFLSVTTIASVPTKSLVNTTTTQAISKSLSPQTVTVASAAGAIVGDWLVVDQELPTDQTNMEAVQIIAFTPTSITGIFRCNHNNGCTITPALLLTLGSLFTLGQDRVLVNWSASSYSSGNITAITGGGFTGSGTGWTTGMVGGNALNIGAITLPADDYPSTPFTALNPLKSVYQIKNLVSSTSLAIMSTSVAADFSYRGFGPPPSGKGAPGSYPYKIVPCAKILRVDSSTGLIICETSTSLWSVGDSVEQVICPYPDVSGYLYAMANWTPGGTYRSFMHVLNNGARAFQTFLQLEERGNVILPGADGHEWTTIFALSCRSQVIIDAVQCINTVSGIRLPSAIGGVGATDAGGQIEWSTAGLRPNSPNLGLDLWGTSNPATLHSDNRGLLAFIHRSTGINSDANLEEMYWGGYIYMPQLGSTTSYLLLDKVTDPVNFERSFYRWEGNDFAIGTEKGGTGTARDMILKVNNVEQLRLIAGDKIKFSSAANFSANGSVATVLGSLGPIGASTTVRKWLTIKDDGGVTGYIPVY
jgi:hypothetical protein